MSPEEANDKRMELFGVGKYTAGFASPQPSFSLDVRSQSLDKIAEYMQKR
jgi:hypothetical protein